MKEWNIWMNHWKQIPISLNWIFPVRKRKIELLYCVTNTVLNIYSYHSQQRGSWRSELFEWIIESKFNSRPIKSDMCVIEYLKYCYVLLTLCWISTHRQQRGRWRSEILEWSIESEFHSHSIESFKLAREWLNCCEL